MSVDGKLYFPVLFTYSEKDFGGVHLSEPDYKSDRFKQLISGGENKSTINDLIKDFEEDDAGESLGLDLGDFEEGDFEEPVFSLSLEDFEEDDLRNLPSTASDSTEAPATGERKYWILWPPVPTIINTFPHSQKPGAWF